MAGDTDRRPFKASNSEMGSKPGGTESVPCKQTRTRAGGDNAQLTNKCHIHKERYRKKGQLFNSEMGNYQISNKATHQPRALFLSTYWKTSSNSCMQMSSI